MSNTLTTYVVLDPDDAVFVQLVGGDLPSIMFGGSSTGQVQILFSATLTPVQQVAWLEDLAARVASLAAQVRERPETAGVVS